MTKVKQGIWLKPIEVTQGGRDYWCADLRAVRQGRKFWPKDKAGKDACQLFCDQVMERERQFGEGAHQLTQEQYVDAIKAYRLLEGRSKSVTLEKIVAEWCGENNHDLIEISMSDAIDAYDVNMTYRGLRPATIKSAIDRANRLGRFVGMDSQVGALRTEHLERFFKRNKIQGNTARTYWTELKVFLDWCVSNKYLRSNPILGIAKPEKIYRDIQVLKPPSELQKILDAAEEIDPNLIIPISIRFFTGVRPSEMDRMKPEDIDLETGYIRVGSAKAKTKRERFVRIEDNLRAILETWEPWDLSWSSYRWQKVCDHAGVNIKSDLARKSYISYHLRHFKDKARTVEYAGNSQSIADQHYIALVSDDQAKEYWGITV